MQVWRCVSADLSVQRFIFSGNGADMLTFRFWCSVVQASICVGKGVQLRRFRCADPGVQQCRPPYAWVEVCSYTCLGVLMLLCRPSDVQ